MNFERVDTIHVEQLGADIHVEPPIRVPENGPRNVGAMFGYAVLDARHQVVSYAPDIADALEQKLAELAKSGEQAVLAAVTSAFLANGGRRVTDCNVSITVV